MENVSKPVVTLRRFGSPNREHEVTTIMTIISREAASARPSYLMSDDRLRSRSSISVSWSFDQPAGNILNRPAQRFIPTSLSPTGLQRFSQFI